ncbi:ABC transporter substrate-binding protein [Aestuariibius insulae]|uniref:ABC transporter substrate-binding protein n=1 Tax=Aestuariibius insulae TaxID=2058287 RepID=UPI00345EEDD6
MTLTRLSIAFIPLTDAAPIIAAEEMGFAREEGLAFNLVRAPSWSSLRDMLTFGSVEAAHLLSPVPVAMALGLGGVASPISALMVLSMNGTVIGVSRPLADAMAQGGHDFDFKNTARAGKAIIAASKGRLRIGVPFPFSMQAELLYYWLSASGLPAPQGVEIRTVPPPLMADALAADEIDAFCVGEPWGSKSVEAGSGELLLPGRAIWSAAPEKVLAVRTDWAHSEPGLSARLMRAVWKACRWLGTGGGETTAAEMLARPAYLDLDAYIIDRALTGRLTINARGDTRDCAGFVEFYHGAANFPWKSQGAWIARQMAARLGLDRDGVSDPARAVFRTDLYRRALAGAGAVLPGASEKIEGGIAEGTAVAAQSGRLLLGENRFFDGRVFDPVTSD